MSEWIITTIIEAGAVILFFAAGAFLTFGTVLLR